MRTAIYDRSNGRLETGGKELLDRWQQASGQLLWVDLDASEPEKQKLLLKEKFELHPLAISDALRDRHPPKLEAFEDYTLLILKGLGGAIERLEYNTLQIAVFCSEHFLITRHSSDSPSINKVWAMCLEDPSLLDAGPGSIAIRIARIVTDRYTSLILGFESQLEQLEDAMMENPNDTILTDLIGYKGHLKKLRRVFTYHSRLFHSLQQVRTPGIADELNHDINDLYEHSERAGSLTQLYYELASDLIDGYISLASHRLNQIMKLLTIITAIFVPITFIAGIYGMNFEYIPELKYHYGYFIALGVMLAIVMSLMIVFKIRKWL